VGNRDVDGGGKGDRIAYWLRGEVKKDEAQHLANWRSDHGQQEESELYGISRLLHSVKSELELGTMVR